MSKLSGFGTVFLAILVYLVPSVGWAACQMSQVNNKKWTLSATDIVHGVLTSCELSISGRGQIASVTNGCFNLYPQQPSFLSPLPYDLKSGTVSLINSAACLFEVNLVLRSDGADSLVGRVSLDLGRTMGSGHFFRIYTGYTERGAGELNLVRLQ